MTGFVIVVDMQRDFVMASGALPVPGAEALIMPMQAWLSALDAADTAGILMTFDTHVPAIYAGSDEAALFPIHCVRDTPGWNSVLDHRGIDPAIPVYTLEKGVFDMWAEEGLTLRSLTAQQEDGVERNKFFADLAASGVDHVTVVGVAADYCVRWAMEGLFARHFQVRVPAALTRGIDRQMDEVAKTDFASVPLKLEAA